MSPKFKSQLKELISYGFFGVLTTLVNMVVFYIFDSVLGVQYLFANAIAIILSILFAYVTNKLFVFSSKTETFKETLNEFFKFIGARLLTGGVDMLTMWALVDGLTLDTNLAKLLTQFVVMVLNYVFSKLFIFK